MRHVALQALVLEPGLLLCREFCVENVNIYLSLHSKSEYMYCPCTDIINLCKDKMSPSRRRYSSRGCSCAGHKVWGGAAGLSARILLLYRAGSAHTASLAFCRTPPVPPSAPRLATWHPHSPSPTPLRALHTTAVGTYPPHLAPAGGSRAAPFAPITPSWTPNPEVKPALHSVRAVLLRRLWNFQHGRRRASFAETLGSTLSRKSPPQAAVFNGDSQRLTAIRNVLVPERLRMQEP